MYGKLRQHVADTMTACFDQDKTRGMYITMRANDSKPGDQHTRISWPQAEYIHSTFDHNTYEVDHDSDFEDGDLDFTLTQQQYQAVLDYGNSKEVLLDILKEDQ
jgi:mannose/cellobiose epimerase-like protein (N-acyl-D-glucosamine 2-epimerase family)